MRRPLLLLATFLALSVATLPLASAQEGLEQARFQSAGLSWEANNPEMAGSFVGLMVRQNLFEDTPSAVSGFEIQADQLEVRREWSNLYLDAPPAVLYSPDAMESQDVRTFTETRIEGVSLQDGHAIYIFPAAPGSVRVSLQCAGFVQPSNNDELKAVHYITTSTTIADSSRALEIKPCAGTKLTLDGAFQVILWSWDSQLHAAEGEELLWSGKAQQEVVPGQDLGPYASRAQQVFITVPDGSFSIVGSQDLPPLLYMDGADLTGVSTMNLIQATGQLTAEAVNVAGRSIEAAGNLSVTLARSDAEIAVQVHQGLDFLAVDGQAVAVRAATVNAGPSPSWILLGALGAVAAPAVMVPLLRRRRTPIHRARHSDAVVEQAWRALEEMDGATAEARGRKLLDWNPTSAVNHFLLGSALRLQQRLEEAVRHHEEARKLEGDWPTDDLPAWNLALGAVSMARHRAQGSQQFSKATIREWVQSAIHIHQEIRSELAAYPDLEEYLSNVDAAYT
ncbi:MAG: hypothetical protein WC876_02080 [Candidatus Thermoplasmatota archaeon]|jgi:hypothetical protein